MITSETICSQMPCYWWSHKCCSYLIGHTCCFSVPYGVWQLCQCDISDNGVITKLLYGHMVSPHFYCQMQHEFCLVLLSIQVMLLFDWNYMKIMNICHSIKPVNDLVCYNTILHIIGLMQERCNSIANTLDLHFCCTNPSILCDNGKYKM